MVARSYGVAQDCEPYGVDDWLLCPDCQRISPLAHELFNRAPVCRDCEREEEARLAGRICRGMYRGNGRPALHDLVYNGHRTDRFDTDPWWEGI
jgi:hypothetical protein